jgi:hypothetical protein
MIAVAAYAALHLALLAYKPLGLASALAGLAIDLRYLLYFGLVYIATQLYPHSRRLFINVGVGGALVVLVFAMLQVFVLPADILKYIGYSSDTIAPYLTIDLNDAFIRINSTLRGPNPLGAYAGVVLALLTAAIAKGKIGCDKHSMAMLSVLVIGGSVALWSSYSRSALLGTAIAVMSVLAVTYGRRLVTNKWVIIGGALMIIFGGLFAINNTHFISNVVLHEDPNGGIGVNSNDDHISSLSGGFNRMMTQPLGAGIGSTGSASLFSDQPTIIENQYLMIAHEAGWLGLVLFLYIFKLVLMRLWQNRNDWLALGVLASGVGLSLIGLLLPVWADDTVSIIWWGLVAIAISRPVKIDDSEVIGGENKARIKKGAKTPRAL